MITKTHQFFILMYSPWPLVARLRAFNLFFSGLVFLKYRKLDCMFLSLFLLRIISFFWWVFYRGEFNLEGKDSFSLENGVKYAILLFIASEVFFFFSFFWSYFHFFLAPCLEVSLIWPPLNIRIFDFLNVPLINTLTLLSSGMTITIRHHYLLKGKIKLSQRFLFVTIILGLFFSCLQIAEYNSAFFRIRDSNFGTTFFMLTGFHGIHVIIGRIFLFISIFRYNKITSNSKDCLRFELASWYWHFVDVVWIFLYFVLYYLTS